MAIATAIQRGSTAYVYDEKNHQIFSVTAGSGSKDGLQGYTSNTVSVRRGSTIYTYNEKGHQIGSHSAG